MFPLEKKIIIIIFVTSMMVKINYMYLPSPDTSIALSKYLKDRYQGSRPNIKYYRYIFFS